MIRQRAADCGTGVKSHNHVKAAWLYEIEKGSQSAEFRGLEDIKIQLPGDSCQSPREDQARALCQRLRKTHGERILRYAMNRNGSVPALTLSRRDSQ
jgi:hypothetical protein